MISWIIIFNFNKRGQMIDKSDYEFINRFDSNNANERERILSSPEEKIEVKMEY